MTHRDEQLNVPSPAAAVIDGTAPADQCGLVEVEAERWVETPIKLLPAALAPSKMYPVIALNSGASDAYGRSIPAGRA